jgi:hypothetical protein
MLQQLGDPFRVFDVGLAARHLFDVAGVDQQHLELPFQNVPDWLPIDPGRFHGQMGHALFAQPISQEEQLRRQGAEGSRLLVSGPLTAVAAHAHHDGFLVDVQTSTAGEKNVHGQNSWWLVPGRQRQEEQSALRALPRWEATISGSQRCPDQTDTRA